MIVESEPGGFSAYVPDLPGCTTVGETREEIGSNIREAIWLYLNEMSRCGIPPPDSSTAAIRVSVTAWHVSKSTTEETPMRVMVIVKATKESEAGEMPDKALMKEMGDFNEELVKAGVMLVGEGLHPTSKGVRVRFSGKDRTVVHGPFAATNELTAGFWLWRVKSMEEAIEWVKRSPNPMMSDSEIEIRRVYEAEDFGAEFTPEMREQEDRLRAEIEAREA